MPQLNLHTMSDLCTLSHVVVIISGQLVWEGFLNYIFRVSSCMLEQVLIYIFGFNHSYDLHVFSLLACLGWCVFV